MSPVIARARTTTGAGVVTILVLVLAFGNQAYVGWADRNAQGASGWELLLRTLAWPKWFVTSGGNPSRDTIAYDIRALLLVVAVAAILAAVGSNVTGGLAAFAVGWFAVIVAAALAALLTAFATTDASFYNALLAAASASAYGLFVGWIVGIVAAFTRRAAVVT